MVAICHPAARFPRPARPSTPHRQPEQYARRRPEKTSLSKIIARHLETWLAERSRGEHPVATHVEDELRAYLRCGILGFGNAYHNRAIATQEIIEELITLAKDLNKAAKRGEEMNLSEEELAFYDALAANESAVRAMGDEKLRVIAAELVTKVRSSVTIDWTLRESARAGIKVAVKRILNRFDYPPDLRDGRIVCATLQRHERVSGDCEKPSSWERAIRE